MEIKKLIVGMVQTNCYIAINPGIKEAVVVDPGGEADRIRSEVQRLGVKAQAILLTHGHFDHVMGVADLVSSAGGRVCIFEGESGLLGDAGLNVSELTGKPVSLRADVRLRDGQVYETADMKFRVIHTPGHTTGSCCYYMEPEKVLFCGDTLFFESIGRSDLPTGNGRQLVDSLKQKVLTLPDDVKAYTGHGPATDIGYEKKNNPFVM